MTPVPRDLLALRIYSSRLLPSKRRVFTSTLGAYLCASLSLSLNDGQKNLIDA